MPLPDRSDPTDDAHLTSYLLGLLPDEEAQRLDQASIADDETASRLRVVENELVDAYVRGALAGEQLERFESHYLASARRRDNVQFAAGFLSAVERAATAQPQHGHQRALVFPMDRVDARPSGSRSPARRLRAPISPKLVAAAAVLLVVCGALLVEVMRLRSGLHVSQSKGVVLEQRARELERQLGDERAAGAKVAQELDRVRESVASTESRSRRPVSGVLTAAFVLSSQTRSIGPVPTIAIAPDADSVAFELRLESNDFPRYQVALNDPATNRVEWRSGPITAQAGPVPLVSVTVPARELKPHHYSLALAGLVAGKTEVVGSYTFQVVRR